MNGSKSFVGRPGKTSRSSFLSLSTSGNAFRLGRARCEQNRGGSDLRLEREMGGVNWGDGAMDRGARSAQHGARSGMEGSEERGAALRGVRVPLVPSVRCDWVT